MRELQQDLDARYRDLKRSRGGPIFFIEHGLSEGDAAAVAADVSAALKSHPLGSAWWSANKLPLIVAATEVGYSYQGSGTDFWPALEARLEADLSVTDRRYIRDLFVDASEVYRGAEPPATPWALAFHMIAWPITHALVPREFHRPLALTLANLRANIDRLADGDLHRAIQIAASTSSARFATLLEDEALAVAVTRRLLGGDHVELCPDTMARISADLDSDHVARRGVVTARRLQRTAAGSSVPAARATPPAIEGALHLRKIGNQISLEVSFPVPPGDAMTRLRRALRRRRYSARLWGASARIPSEQFLSGLPFAVRLAALPEADAELLPGLDDLELDRELTAALASFTLDATPPLLFSVTSDGASGRRIRGPKISGDRMYWLLSEPGGGPSGCPEVGAVGPYECHLLDPSGDLHRAALGRLGFQVAFGVSVAFAGAPPLNRGGAVPEFAADDERFVIPRRVSTVGLEVRLNADQISLNGGELVGVTVSLGEHELRVSSEGAERRFLFRGVPAPPPPPLACTIAARSSDLSVQALLRGVASFSVDSFAPLEGLELTASLDVGARIVSATAALPPLPTLISSAQEPFVTLLDDETRALLARAPSPTLRLSVGRICSSSFVLAHRLRSCWWREDERGSVTLTSEVGDLSFGSIPASAPASNPSCPAVTSADEAQLLAPADLDVSEYGGAAPFTTLCVAPDRARLQPPTAKKPRLMRRRRGTNGALGLEDLTESYLRWTLAESASLIAEFRRRQVASLLDEWVVESCCGVEWARRERGLRGMDPWMDLRRACDEAGMGRDPYVQLNREDEREVTRAGVREIRRELPELWSLVGPPSDLGPGDYEALDLACGRAYAELAEGYRRRGMSEVAEEVGEGDPGAAAEEWDEVLEGVKSAAESRRLAELLIPTDLAHKLMALEPGSMSLDEMTEELFAWAREGKQGLMGATPAPKTLKAALALWLEPEVAVGLDWRAAVGLLLSERTVARAARFMALRGRQVNPSGSRS